MKITNGKNHSEKLSTKIDYIGHKSLIFSPPWGSNINSLLIKRLNILEKLISKKKNFRR